MGYAMLFAMIVCIWISTIERIDIAGCDARGDGHLGTYLTRFVLFRWNGSRLYLHKFKRSDYDDLHDHPWNFISFVFWGGYNEVTKNECIGFYNGVAVFRDKSKYGLTYDKYTTTRIKPFSLIFRKAEHLHRVSLINNKPAYSLVLTFYKHRRWGFVVNDKWKYWKDYVRDLGCS